MVSSIPSPALSTLSTLPAELRLKIWHDTFEPRTLSVSIHLIETHFPYTYNIHPEGVDCYVNTAAFTFTARLGLHPGPPSKEYAKQKPLFPQIRFRGHDLLPLLARVKPPPGPIALHVCRESRALALQNYTWAFPGQNVMGGWDTESASVFQSPGLGLGNIWVNFTIDTVFLAYVAPSLLCSIRGTDTAQWYLGHFATYAAEEVKRVERLAIRGTWRNEGELWKDIRSGVYGLREGLMSNFKCIVGCRELTVYVTDSDGQEDGGDGDTSGQIRNEEEIASEIVDVLTVEREKNEEWTAPLPMVKVTRAMQWRRDTSGKLRLQLLSFPGSQSTE